jgi:hemerythrin superfamily protein
MATRTRSRSNRSEGSSHDRGSRSAFAWNGQSRAITAAAFAGVAVGLAANFGRKLVVQNIAGAAGDWVDVLTAEHHNVLAIFDKIEATADDQVVARRHLLTKLRNALGKHAIEEENVIYPALREANSAHDADALNAEHGYVKTFLYELEKMPADSPNWLSKVRDFRTILEEHMQMEEREAFPSLRDQLSEERNAELGAAMKREGLKLA